MSYREPNYRLTSHWKHNLNIHSSERCEVKWDLTALLSIPIWAVRKVISLLKVLGKEANLVFSSRNDMFTQMQMWVYSICNSFVKWKLGADSSFLCPSWSCLNEIQQSTFISEVESCTKWWGRQAGRAQFWVPGAQQGAGRQSNWPQNSISRNGAPKLSPYRAEKAEV